MNKKILVIYTSVGLGHKIIAENIAAELRKQPPHPSSPSRGEEKEGVEIELLDVIQFYGGAVQDEFQRFYLWLLRRIPWLWRFFYTNRVFNALTLPLRIPAAALRAKKLAGYLAAAKPDLILTTETIPTAIVSYLKLRKKYTGKLVTTFSDYHFQPYWVYPRVDRFLAIIPEHVDNILNRDYGYKREQITITGMPLDAAFAKQSGDAPRKNLIAVMGGSRGWGMGSKEILALLALPEQPAVAVFTGTSQELYEEFSVIARQNSRLTVHGWLPNSEIAKIFSQSKILITKAGGLTAAGAIAAGLPMVFINPLHIGEELNEDYLIKHGVGFRARNLRELGAQVSRLLHDEKHYHQARAKLRALATPQAAARAARAIIDIL